MAKDTGHTGAWLLGLAGAAGAGTLLGIFLCKKTIVRLVDEGYVMPTPEALKQAGVPSDVAEAARQYAASQYAAAHPSVQGWMPANGRGEYGRR